MLAYLRCSPELARLLGAVPMRLGTYGLPNGNAGIACLLVSCENEYKSRGLRVTERAAAIEVQQGLAVTNINPNSNLDGVMFWPLVHGALDR